MFSSRPDKYSSEVHQLVPHSVPVSVQAVPPWKGCPGVGGYGAGGTWPGAAVGYCPGAAGGY